MTSSRWVSRPTLMLIVLSVGVLLLGLTITSPNASASPAEGLECETSDTNSFTLTATTGYILTPDGNSIFMWSYAGTSGQFQLPGPTLCVAEGSTVTVVLHNSLPEPTSVIFPGQTGVRADGAPAQPTFSAGALTSLVQPAAASTGTVTYSFVASHPGTFLYESGTDVAKQVQMGLYGALIVRPVEQGLELANQAYHSADSTFDPQHEYLHLLSEIDPALHQAVERNKPYDVTKLTARYFLINGRSMPDTLSPNDAAYLPAQPYGATVHIQPYQADPNLPGEHLPALIRYLNAGTGTYPFHPHGADQRVIGRDGNPLGATATAPDRSYDKFLIDIGPGQTYDTTLAWVNAEDYSPDNPIPVDLPALQDQIVTPDSWFSESPYLGFTNALPVGVTNNNECGEYYHVAHSHALQQATNYGATFGGMMTLIRIDPPAGCPTP